jgi:hypothetical protein
MEDKMDYDDFDDDFMEDYPEESYEETFEDPVPENEFADLDDEELAPDPEVAETKTDGFDFGTAFVVGSMIAGNMYDEAEVRRIAEKQRKRKKKHG